MIDSGDRHNDTQNQESLRSLNSIYSQVIMVCSKLVSWERGTVWLGVNVKANLPQRDNDSSGRGVVVRPCFLFPVWLCLSAVDQNKSLSHVNLD